MHLGQMRAKVEENEKSILRVAVSSKIIPFLGTFARYTFEGK